MVSNRTASIPVASSPVPNNPMSKVALASLFTLTLIKEVLAVAIAIQMQTRTVKTRVQMLDKGHKRRIHNPHRAVPANLRPRMPNQSSTAPTVAVSKIRAVVDRNSRHISFSSSLLGIRLPMTSILVTSSPLGTTNPTTSNLVTSNLVTSSLMIKLLRDNPRPSSRAMIMERVPAKHRREEAKTSPRTFLQNRQSLTMCLLY